MRTAMRNSTSEFLTVKTFVAHSMICIAMKEISSYEILRDTDWKVRDNFRHLFDARIYQDWENKRQKRWKGKTADALLVNWLVVSVNFASIEESNFISSGVLIETGLINIRSCSRMFACLFNSSVNWRFDVKLEIILMLWWSREDMEIRLRGISSRKKNDFLKQARREGWARGAGHPLKKFLTTGLLSVQN